MVFALHERANVKRTREKLSLGGILLINVGIYISDLLKVAFH